MDQKAFHMTLLFDFYGDLLTDRQKEFYDLYHNEDLSLAEIAENAGITRQGVRDVLVRAENTLEELEAKTGIVRRFLVVRMVLVSLFGLKALSISLPVSCCAASPAFNFALN